MEGAPNAFLHAIAQSPVALAIVFAAVLLARVLDRRLGELAAAPAAKRRLPPRPKPEPPR